MDFNKNLLVSSQLGSVSFLVLSVANSDLQIMKYFSHKCKLNFLLFVRI